MDIVTFATEKYQWLLRPLASLYEKYVGGKIICFGDLPADGLPTNAEFRHAPFLGEMGTWDWTRDFGAGFASCLQSLKDPVVLVSLPDMWPTGPAHLDKVRSLTDLMASRQRQIVRVLVGDDGNLMSNQGQRGESWDGLTIATVRTDDPNVGMCGGFLLWPSLWNRELTLSLLENCSIWDFETIHSRKMLSFPDLFSAWILGSVYPYAHVLFRQHPERVFLNLGFGDEDKKLIKSFLPEGMEVVE